MGQRLFDQYSLLHLAVGIVFYFWNVSFAASLLLHTVFELLENTDAGIKLINRLPLWPGGKPRADTPTNMLGDSVAFTVGWLVAQAVDTFGSQRGWYEPHLSDY